MGRAAGSAATFTPTNSPERKKVAIFPAPTFQRRRRSLME
jgi:hypothetical protein